MTQTTDTLTSTRESAANLKCGGCKAKGHVTYTVETTMSAYDGRPASSAVLKLDGKTFSIRDRYDTEKALYRPCPKCGSNKVTVKIVRGFKVEDKACDNRCRNATGGDCECSCVGENHGVNNASW